MKAVIQHEFGGPDVLTYTEVEKPSLHNHEVLIKAAYTSVNYADIKSRLGNKGKGTFPLTLGLDVAGTVEEASSHSGFRKGASLFRNMVRMQSLLWQANL